MATGACSRRLPPRSRRRLRTASAGLRARLSGARNRPPAFPQALEHGAGLRDDAVDDPFPELDRSRVGLADHAAVGEARIIAAPGPGGSASEDQRLDLLRVRRLLGAPDLVAAHELRRQRQHYRGLARPTMNVRIARTRLGLRQVERVNDAGV